MRYSKFILCSLLLLTGCSSVSLRDSLSDAGAATVAATVATINPVAGIAAGVATGITINTVTQPEEVNLAQVTNVHQEKVAEKQIQADLIESLGVKGIIGAIAAFILSMLVPWAIGRVTPRRREIELEAKESERKRMAEARM